MSTLKQRFAKLAELHPEITQADLARATGAKPPSVNAWFSGETKSMKATTAAKAALLYGCSPHWLATGEGVMLAAGGEVGVSNVTAMPAPTLRGLDAVLAELQAVVDGLSPLLQDAGRAVLVKWLNGQASRSDAVATLEGLRQASAGTMPDVSARAA